MSFRDQLVRRREFILSRPEIRQAAPVPTEEDEPAGSRAAGKKGAAGGKTGKRKAGKANEGG